MLLEKTQITISISSVRSVFGLVILFFVSSLVWYHLSEKNSCESEQKAKLQMHEHMHENVNENLFSITF